MRIIKDSDRYGSFILNNKFVTEYMPRLDGRMLPCGMMPRPEVSPLEMGFEAAWKRLREETAGVRMPAACGSCPKRSACTVCAAMCVTETGDFDRVPAYVCRMTDAVIRETIRADEERN